jgi:plasmid stabilization system protein ParE
VRYRITHHENVLQDFAKILEFIGNYAGYATGRSKIAAIKQSISVLKDYPHTGSSRHDIVPGLRALPSAEKGVICFTVDDDARTVRIVCITYAGQDWQKIASQRSEA